MVYFVFKVFFITLFLLIVLGLILVGIHNLTGLSYPTFSKSFFISLVLLAFILSFLIPFKIEEKIFSE